jgi:hypothetical protein
MTDPATPMPADEALLRDALAAVTGERRKAYGDPEQNFTTIADLWNAYLCRRAAINAHFTPGDVAQMMILVKVARLAQTPDHRDSMLDIAGYAACAARCNP